MMTVVVDDYAGPASTLAELVNRLRLLQDRALAGQLP